MYWTRYFHKKLIGQKRKGKKKKSEFGMRLECRYNTRSDWLIMINPRCNMSSDWIMKENPNKYIPSWMNF